jgi:hypothetical protein
VSVIRSGRDGERLGERKRSRETECRDVILRSMHAKTGKLKNSDERLVKLKM